MRIRSGIAGWVLACLALAVTTATGSEPAKPPVPSAAAGAGLRLPHVFGDNMVLQRDVTLPVWGWAEPGEKVVVRLGDVSVSTEANAEGRWLVKLPAMKAGGPFALVVTGRNEVSLKNVMIGEVWICSGQSNMDMNLANAEKADGGFAAANFSDIRLFKVPVSPAGEPVDDLTGIWKPCQPGNAAAFSAVGYFFGRKLHKELQVPVGLIHSALGGTCIEAWTAPEGFAAVQSMLPVAKDIEATSSAYRKNLPGMLDQIDIWSRAMRQAAASGASLPQMPALPAHPLASNAKPTGLYNGMIRPLAPYAIRGVIWYQGESNRSDGMIYRDKMQALISGWRKVWNQGDFPFYFVQLAPFRYGRDATMLPRLWEAQTAALTITNTGMAVTVDIGTVGNIHPPNKHDVGKRLALWALARDYGRKGLLCSGPLYKSMSIKGNRVSIKFEHTGGGLMSRDGKPLSWFEVAGEDRKFVKAQAEIDGSEIVVSANEIVSPVAVRLGWSEEAEPNLMNKEGLPASPFRTDRW